MSVAPAETIELPTIRGNPDGSIDVAVDADGALPIVRPLKRLPPALDAVSDDGSLAPPTEPIRRRLSSNVVVTQKRIKNAKASNEVTMMHIFRSFVGAGILSMPYAFSHAGIALAPPGLIAVGAIVVYSCFCLVAAAQQLSEDSGVIIVDYGETFQAALKVGPKWCRERLAVHGKTIINVLICILQPGFCAPYIVFIAENFKDIAGLTMSIRLVMLTLIPILLLLMMIRSSRILGYVSLTGNIVFMVGFVIILQHIVQEPMAVKDLPKVVDSSKWATFFSSCVFAFEGIIPLLHLKAQMKTPKALFGFNGVLLTSFYYIVICYFTMGFFGYLKYGVDVEDTITKNLPDEEIYKSLKMIYSCVLLASFPIQMLPVVEILYFDFLYKFVPERPPIPKVCFELLFRVALVFCVSILPITLPTVGHLIEFFGATLGTTFAIALPNIIQLLVRWSKGDWGRWYFFLLLHGFILVICVVLIFVGSYTSSLGLAEAFSSEK